MFLTYIKKNLLSYQDLERERKSDKESLITYIINK